MATDTFTATGTWTCPDGVTRARVQCWGGGGSGGSGTGNPAEGGGGAGGAYAESIINVIPQTVYTVTVGATQSTAATAGNPSWFGEARSELMTTDQRETEGSLAWSGISGVTLTQDSTQAHSGTFAVKAVSDGTANGRWFITNNMTGLSAGKTYWGEAWVWTTLTTQIHIEVDWKQSGGTYISTTVGSNFTPTASTWTKITFVGTAPALTAEGTVIIKPNSVAAGNTWWTDDHSFGEIACYAQGGAGGTTASTNSSNGTGGTGSSANSSGDTVFAGGNGANGDFANSLTGGAGGGGAGTSGAGGNASGNTGGSGTGGGGAGANGVADSTAGAAGTAPGGGGSGGDANTATDRLGGSGARGQVLVNYEANTATLLVVQQSAINTACNW